MTNASLDRFDGNDITDDYVDCANCGASRPYSGMIYDEHAEVNYCDDQCFDEWADNNVEVVNGFYFELNCH